MLTPDRKRRAWRRLLLCVSLAAVPLLALLPHSLAGQLGWPRYGFIERVENYLYDLRLRTTIAPYRDPAIVIIDIDERSLAAEGRWPWSRDKMARLVDQMFDLHGIRVVGFDITWPEPEETTGARLLNELTKTAGTFGPQRAAMERWIAERRPAFATDARLAESFVARDVVLGFAFRHALIEGQPVTLGKLPPAMNISGAVLDRVPWNEAVGFTGNLPMLQDNALAGGFFDTATVDEDGVIRRMPLLQRYQGKLYESLALAVARVGKPGARIEFAFRGRQAAVERLDYIKLGDTVIPVDEHGAMLIPFSGPSGTFDYVSATDVLNAMAPLSRLKDAIVLVGTSAPGNLDLRPTPFQTQYIGVEAHATAVSGLLRGGVWAVPPRATLIEIAVLVLLALLLGLWVPRLAPVAAVSVIGLALLAAIGLNLALWRGLLWVLPLATWIIYIAAAALLLLFFGFFVEARRKGRVQKVMGQYLPPALVAQMDPDEVQVSLQGESREMSVLFADVRGFTTLSEGLAPRELTQLMNAYLTPVTAVIGEYRGTIDKYMGDAVMAFWGAPLADAEHARNAVLAALRMLTVVQGLKPEFARRGWPAIEIGVGISTGEMNVGNMGSDFRVAYTVLGDAVNLGSRLEGLTKQYGVRLLVSADTRNALTDVACREIDQVRVKGKSAPVTIYEPLGLASEVLTKRLQQADLFALALRSYRARDFLQARSQIELLQQAGYEKLYSIYLERIALFVQQPPAADWDGVYAFATK